MELIELIEILSKPSAYPHEVDVVEVRQTHISVVFLAGRFAYKLKKPVNLGFLDFTTLEKRRHYCEEEVRLNRRLARSVYLGIVPVTADGRIEGASEPVDWLVKMERLPEGTSLLDRLKRGEVDEPLVESLAARVAEFHAGAERNPRISQFGRFDVVAGNARENFDQSAAMIGRTVSQRVFERLRARTAEVLDELRPLIEARAARGVPCDTHGDLHLDHVYHFPERRSPDDLIIIDCIEFNERFRYADPVADAAFLVMDLLFRGCRDLANRFTDAYFEETGDGAGLGLLPFYIAYRAMVRGKVEGFQLAELEIPEEERVIARRRARARWLLALGELEVPARRPALVLIGGLPGSGKSTLARGLAGRGSFTVIRSDVVRKELAGLPADVPAHAGPDEGIYTPEMSRRTYVECLRRAEDLLFEGNRVIVDANFGREDQRRSFLDAAARLCLPARLFVCRAAPEISRQRISARRGDTSDADVAIYDRLAERWEDTNALAKANLTEIATNGPPGESLEQALNVLRQVQLLT